MQATVHCGAGALASLVLLTVEIMNINGSQTPTEARAFVALPLVLLCAGFWKWWAADEALRRVSYMMAAARAPVRALCASTAANMQQLRIFPQVLLASMCAVTCSCVDVIYVFTFICDGMYSCVT